ncbi:TonB-dependent receptor [Desulfosarcina ovata]|uniref:TonB-dependent receptor n=1 Tax=Desulfosarcina ovata subsp. ovata TaxID=2752305 RepID=A0A5K8AD89_9BACT|nr:TonB-dependent receptor [Desulfosarcina ovata]BBO90572.1 TonB-dependent receptor [Desulfosarcina ovata subsp. ovata]
MPGVRYCFSVASRFPSFGLGILALLAAILAGAWFVPPSASAQPDSNQTRMYNIPAGSLEDSLNTFAVQAGITLTFDPALLEGKTVQGLNGIYSVTNAMAILLENSGLKAHKNGESSYHLEPIPVTGNKEVTMPAVHVAGKAISDAGTETLPIDRIQRNLATDMADIFRDEPSVVVGGGTRNSQRIYVRGIEASNLNVTIDGAVQGRNLFQHRGSIGGMDPDLLKRVEVTTGPSALSGAGALGGSIRMETVDAQDMLADGRHVGAKVEVGASGADDGYRGSTSVYGAYEGFGLLGYVSGANFEDYRDGDGNDVHGSAGRDRDYFLKFSMLDQADHQLRISAQENENSGLYRWGAGDTDYDETADLYYQESDRQTLALGHRYRPADNPWVDWRFNAYLNQLFLENVDLDTLTESEGWGTNLSNTASFKLGMTRHRLTIGSDYYAEEGIHESDGAQVGTDNEVGNLGVYIQEQMNLGPFLLTLGARYDDYETDFGEVTISGDEICPSAGLEVAMGYGFTAFGGYGESVRSTGIIPVQWLSTTTDNPTFNQQAEKDSYGSSFEPETATQYEGGLRFEHEGLLMDGDRLDIQVTYFETEIENLIVQIGGRRGAPVTGFYNDDPMTSKGWEARATWRTGDFKTSMSYTHARTEDENGDLIAITRRKGASTGDRFVWDSFWQMRERFGVGYTLEAVGGIDEDDIDRCGYVLHHVQAQWQSVIPNLDVTLAVRNLFDHYYSEQTTIGEDGTATAEPGRDVRVSVAYRF